MLSKLWFSILWIISEGKFSFRGLFIDWILVKRRNRIELTNYILGNLQTRQYTTPQRLDFLGWEQSEDMMNRVNSPEQRSIVNSKYGFKKAMYAAGVRVPEMYGYFAQKELDLEGHSRIETLQDLHDLIIERKLKKCVLKPTHSMHGVGFQIFVTGDPAGPRQINRETDPSTIFPEGMGWFMVEEFIQQHHELADINPNSLNTLRIWTFLDKSGSVETLGAFMRFSSNKTPVDNTSAGGICAKIDWAEGVISSPFFEVHSHLKRYTEHPLTGVRAHGRKIPFHKELQESVVRAAQAFPKVQLLALDFAIDEEGPVCIEGNHMGHYQGQFLIGQGFGKYA